MSFMDYFRSGKKQPGNSASAAKERLQIIVAHERNGSAHLDYLPQLQKELLQVIRKYVAINDDQVQVDIDRNDDCSVLELNVTLPEGGKIKAAVEPAAKPAKRAERADPRDQSKNRQKGRKYA